MTHDHAVKPQSGRAGAATPQQRSRNITALRVVTGLPAAAVLAIDVGEAGNVCFLRFLRLLETPIAV
jgi:hypothetical protein